MESDLARGVLLLRCHLSQGLLLLAEVRRYATPLATEGYICHAPLIDTEALAVSRM